MDLTYLANPGENPNTDTVIVPQLPQVLVASNLQYVTFQGLTFEHDNYTMPAAGYQRGTGTRHQRRSVIPEFAAHHVRFRHGDANFRRGYGIYFLHRQYLAELVRFDSTPAESPRTTWSRTARSTNWPLMPFASERRGHRQTPTRTSRSSIPCENNVVEGYGRMFPSSKGITQGQGHDNLYTHNDVYDGYKGAIHVCYWPTPTSIRHSRTTTHFLQSRLQPVSGIMNDSGSLYFGVGTISPPSSGTGNKCSTTKFMT